MPQSTSYHKVTPPKQEFPIALAMGGIVFIGVLLLIALLLSAATDVGDNTPPTPTTIPAPRFASGNEVVQDQIAFVTRDVAFSLVAAPNYETDTRLTACTQIQITPNVQDGHFFYLESSSGYWVFAVGPAGNNGWLPLDGLSDEKPANCP